MRRIWQLGLSLQDTAVGGGSRCHTYNPSPIVRICLLFIKLSPVIVIRITAGQYPQRPFSVHSFPCSLFDGLEALLYFTSSKSVAVNPRSKLYRIHAHNSLEPRF